MNKGLERIVYELNPLNDMKNIHLENGYKSLDIWENTKAELRNASKFFLAIKPVARGAMIGGIIGSAISYINATPLIEGLAQGSQAGAFIDYAQFAWRMTFKYYDARYTDVDNNKS
jgi:hypothetical protein